MKRLLVTFFLAAMACACSTTRSLPEGQYRLARNYVEVSGQGKTSALNSDLSQYVLQKPNSYWFFGWSPSLNIYNWTEGNGNGWSRFCEKVGVAPVAFNSSLVEPSGLNIAKRLEYLGYYGSHVYSRTDTVRRLVRVHYNVIPGSRHIISSINYTLPKDSVFCREFYADTVHLSLKPGMYLSEDLLEKETVRSSAVLRSKGYYDFSKNNYFFQADTLTSPGSTVLNYEIRNYTRNEGASAATKLEKYYFGHVEISHTDEIKFSNRVLTGLNLIRPGEVYDPKIVNDTYTRLSALKVFNSVQIEMTPVDSGRVDCEIRLRESKIHGVKANLEASVNVGGLLGIAPKVSYYNKNLFHGGEWLSVSFNGIFQMMYNDPSVKSTELGVQASLSLPKFLGIPYRSFHGANIPRTEFKVSYNYQDRPEFKKHLASFSYGYTGRIGEGFVQYQFYPQQFTLVKLKDMDDAFYMKLITNPYMAYSYQDHFDSAISGTLQYSTSKEAIPKTSYFSVRFNADLAGNVISLWRPIMSENEYGQKLAFGVPYTQYSKSEVSLVGVHRWGSKNGQAFAARLLAGIGHAYGNSTTMPFEKQFYAGGASSMRAWQSRTLGAGRQAPSDFFSIPSQSGDMKLELDLEYRLLMFWKLEAALFAEAGNVWTLQNVFTDDDPGDIRYGNFFESVALDWGVGLRVNLNLLVLRLDWGFKLYNPSLAASSSWVRFSDWFNESSLQFGVGYPF